MKNPYRDIPRPLAKEWFDEIRGYIDGGKVHDRPEAVARLNDVCERLWDQIPRLTEKPVWWLHRALWFDHEEVDQFRREEKVMLSGRPFMSWSRHPKAAVASNGLGMFLCSRSHTLVLITADIPAADILCDVDSLGRRAGYRITQFQWNGGEREFIVRHREPVQVYTPEWVQVYQMDRLEAGDIASIRLDGKMARLDGKMAPEMIALIKARAMEEDGNAV